MFCLHYAGRLNSGVMSHSFKIALTVLLVATALASGCNRQVVADQRACSLVEKGMRLTQVLSIMGEPQNRSISPHSLNQLSLYYSTPAMASGPITVAMVDNGPGPIVDYTLCNGQT